MRWGGLALVALLGAACQVDARSDQFRCGDGEVCGDGRTCVAGWCVEGDGGGSPIDADPDRIDASEEIDAPFVCPPACDSCVDGGCVIDCAGASACTAEVVCPAGIPCTVNCSGVDSCGGGVDCSAASACDVECIAETSCGGAITCGTGRCLVRCTAIGTCQSDIDCNAACGCDVECSGAGSCAGNEDCPGGGSCDPGQGCTSSPPPCDNCPA